MRREIEVRRRARTWSTTLGVAWLFAASAGSGDWPRFRGPGLDGVSDETGLLKEWPESGPERVWKAVAGDGYSGLSVASGRVFTMFNHGDSEFVVALDAATGKEQWRLRTDAGYSDGQGGGPRSTPAVDGDRVYALGARGKLVALRTEDGKALWSADLVKDLGAEPPQWGIATAPLVEGDLLLVNAGGSKGRSVVAFDKKTGKVKWSAEDDGAGYASPLPVVAGGTRQVLFFLAHSLVSLDPKTGKRFWSIPWETSYDVNAATPVFVPPDRLFVSSGYDTGSALLRLKGGVGEAAVEEIWKSRVMKNQFSSSVVTGGHVYGFDNRILKCIELASGEERWKTSGLGHGSLLLADGLLIVLSESGRLLLVEATPEAYREKAAAEVLEGKCWTVPTLAAGRLYVRNEKEILCLKVKG